MKALSYTLHLEEPLLATQPFSGEANSATSFSFIPGSMIRGALVGAYLNSGLYPDSAARSDDLLEDENARRLFFEEKVFFLNAYPVRPGQKERMLPTPLSWFVPKDERDDDEAEIYNFADAVDPDVDKPKRPYGEFCYIIGESATLLDTPHQISVHNASQNRNQKKTGSSQVFRYDALAPGQQVSGIILADDEEDLSKLKTLLETRIVTVGGSHTSGYGLVTVESGEPVPWTGEYQAAAQETDDLVVTLVSDAVLRSHGASLNAAVAEALGATAEALGSFHDIRPAGGFNRKWGLPLAQQWALKAGSVFTFPRTAVSKDKITALVETGIGERRSDGFGRIAVDWHPRPIYQQRPAGVPRTSKPTTFSTLSADIAARMAKNRLRQKLEDALTEQLTRRSGPIKSQLAAWPSNTQLSRLRVVTRRAQAAADLSLIEKHLAGLKLAKREWEKVRLDGELLNSRIIQMCQFDEAKFRAFFGLTESLPAIAGQRSELTPALRTEYQARFINGLMKLAIELRRKPEVTKEQNKGGKDDESMAKQP